MEDSTKKRQRASPDLEPQLAKRQKLTPSEVVTLCNSLDANRLLELQGNCNNDNRASKAAETLYTPFVNKLYTIIFPAAHPELRVPKATDAFVGLLIVGHSFGNFEKVITFLRDFDERNKRYQENLRQQTRHPAGDVMIMRNGTGLLGFFDVGGEQTMWTLQRRFLLFLLKTIYAAGEWIDEWKADNPSVDLEEAAQHWREYLGKPRGHDRVEFFNKASDGTPMKDFNILEADEEDVQVYTRRLVKDVAEKLTGKGVTQAQLPLILFYFDEAHNLTGEKMTVEGTAQQTAYQCLCKAFTYLAKTPTFALFLSTDPRLVSEFAPSVPRTPSVRHFWSYRGGDNQGSAENLHAPFVELPFDNSASPIVTEGAHPIDEFSTLPFMARFGRPLQVTYMEDLMDLAMYKLKLTFELKAKLKFALHEDTLLPPLALRVDLNFEPNRDEAVFLEGLLVAGSMRTVYSVPRHRQYLRCGYSSEPFVAEAAARVIFQRIWASVEEKSKEIIGWEDRRDKIIKAYKDMVPLAISKWFRAGLINNGGELVARMLITQAHDLHVLNQSSADDFSPAILRPILFSQKISVVDFLRSLIGKKYHDTVLGAKPQNVQGKPLKEAFEGAFISFTHFVKGGDDLVATDEGCYGFFSRSAAIQGGHVDLANIYLLVPICVPCKGYPDRHTMTVLVIQVKDCGTQSRIFIDIEKRFKFFSHPEKDPENPRPYISIVMELELNTPLKVPKKAAKSEAAKSAGQKVNKSSSTPPSSQAPVDKLPSSPTDIHIGSKHVDTHNLRVPDRKPHPRYEIYIGGCSSDVYNVVDDSARYKTLLANKNLLDEHPRRGEEYLNAAMQMKPEWKKDTSYNWLKVMDNSCIGAQVQKTDDDVDMDAGDNDDEERPAKPKSDPEDYACIFVSGFDDGEDEEKVEDL
ncbi:hypothetical protein DXG01_001170 [Tephrocybe rancida]|nr:hypothetical protein DXG01_001170 [Tephrocybe rancida]